MAIFEGLIGNIVLGVFGIVILLLSAEFVVRKLIKIAHHFGVSDTFIGLTVMSIGTSLPEIGSHLAASFGILTNKLDYEIASATVLGANIGSDVVQQTFVLGLVIFMMGSLTFSKSFLKKGYLLMIGTTLMCLILGWDGTYSRWDGLILFGTFVLYMWFLYKHEERHVPKADPIEGHVATEIFLVIFGMAVLLGSSTMVLKVTEYIVKATGIGGSLIGVLTLGVAAALPEMFTAIEGIRKKASGISLGTLIGSNITNPLVAIGLGGMMSEYFVPKPLVYWDLPMETITAALLLLWLLTHKRTLKRGGAVYLMCLYFAYAIIRIIYFPVD
ncbi:sodium:calcium antiporter [Nanoarchaeota archaeon]